MDIDYHYFVVKTLACKAGFAEEDAQTIAYYSQQVDDFVKCSPMRVRQEPPDFFVRNGYAVKSIGGTWQMVPHPTGIDVVQSVNDAYRRATLAAFHFIPDKPLSEIETKPGFTRADYRCVRADDMRAVLINRIIDDAVREVQEQKSEKSLMQLGMALHTYADTYAHCGYSGLEGWENHAVIKKAYNQQTKKEEVPAGERLVYSELPHIGHGNAGHVPDICTYQIDVAMKRDERDEVYEQHIVRDNLEEFLNCAKVILKYLAGAAKTDACENIVWDELRVQLAEAMQMPTAGETNEHKLIQHWKKVFPEIAYVYDKTERFYSREDMTLMSYDEAGSEMTNMSSCEAVENLTDVSDMDASAEHVLSSIRIYHVTDAFYMYNELAYRRAQTVLGTEEPLMHNIQMLAEGQYEG